MEAKKHKSDIDVEELMLSPLEKMVKFIQDAKEYLESLENQEASNHAENLTWVFQRMLSSSLYSYDLFKHSDIFGKKNEDDDDEEEEYGNIVNYVNDYDITKLSKQKKAFEKSNEKEDDVDLVDLTKNSSYFYKKKNQKPASLFKNAEISNIESRRRKLAQNRKAIQEGENEETGKSNTNAKKEEEKESEELPDAVIDYIIDIQKGDESSSSSAGGNSPCPMKKSVQNLFGEEGIIPDNVKLVESQNKKESEKFNKGIVSKSKSFSSKNVISFKNILKRKLSSPSINPEKILAEHDYTAEYILSKEFDIFTFRNNYGYSKVLPIIAKVLYQHYGLEEIISKSKLDNFIYSISSCYVKEVLYHNAMHGIDVTQSVSLHIMNSDFETKLFATKKDILALITSALGHDIGHPGLNNAYLINCFSEIAVNYNDKSVLENFHSANLFRIIKERQNNIFENFNQLDFKNLRKRIISQILATDMAEHFRILGGINTLILANKDKEVILDKEAKNLFQQQQEYFDFVVHTSDIAHNAKKFKYSVQWVELLTEEFWLQGDKEKKNNMEVSMLCNRENVNIPKSQVFFINTFIIPSFEAMVKIFPSLEFFLENAKTNLNIWKKYEEEKRKTGFPSEKL